MDINVAGLNKVTCKSDSSHNGRTVTISDGTNTWSGTIANITGIGYACIFMIPSMPAPAKKKYTVILKNSAGTGTEYSRNIELGFGDSIIVGLSENDEVVTKGTVPTATSSRTGGVKITESTSNGIYLNNGSIELKTATSSQKGGVKVTDSTSNGVYMSGDQLKTNVASSSQIGCMKTGTGLTASSGVVSLNTATENSLGGIKIGNGLKIESGSVSVKPAGSTSSTRGAIYVSAEQGFTLDSDGELHLKKSTGITTDSSGLKLSPATTSSLGGVTVGNGLYVSSGNLHLDPTYSYCVAYTSQSYTIDAHNEDKITITYSGTSKINALRYGVPIWVKRYDSENAQMIGHVMSMSIASSSITFVVSMQNLGLDDVTISSGQAFRVYYTTFY